MRMPASVIVTPIRHTPFVVLTVAVHPPPIGVVVLVLAIGERLIVRPCDGVGSGLGDGGNHRVQCHVEVVKVFIPPRLNLFFIEWPSVMGALGNHPRPETGVGSQVLRDVVHECVALGRHAATASPISSPQSRQTSTSVRLANLPQDWPRLPSSPLSNSLKSSPHSLQSYCGHVSGYS